MKSIASRRDARHEERIVIRAADHRSGTSDPQSSAEAAQRHRRRVLRVSAGAIGVERSRAAQSDAPAPQRCLPQALRCARARRRGARDRCRECRLQMRTRLGTLFTAPGNTPHTPTVPTVSRAPVALSGAPPPPARSPPRPGMRRGDPASAPRRHGRLRPRLDSQAGRRGDGRDDADVGRSCRSSSGPCSMCSSTNAA